MDSKNQENHLKKYDEKSFEKLQYRTVFNNPTYSFVFKKTEKIVAALYLITNLISDTEPIKLQIRKISLGLMSDMLALKYAPSAQLKQNVVGLMTCISEMASLLKIAAIAGDVSTMNHSIIQKEFALLMDALQGINEETVGSGSPTLFQDFFNVPTNFSLINQFPNVAPQAFSSKGQYRTNSGVKDNAIQSTPKDNLKDNRNGKILQLLKAGKPLGIKDFSREIKDCSEKTIQRELLAMVENGVLKKTGERRWSLYSLA